MANTDAYLSNPIWHALTSHHAAFALGGDLARRYPTDMAPFGAVATYDKAAFDSLAALIPSGQIVSVINAQAASETQWTMVRQFPLIQMVYDGSALSPEPSNMITPLFPEHVPDMFKLVEASRPGPFMQRTIALGRYLAIWQDGQIAAMAGERFHLPGYREISAVTTHPDYQRRGYARMLIRQLIYDIQSAGEVPFLHVTGINANAQTLYESLGFKRREEFTMCVLKRL